MIITLDYKNSGFNLDSAISNSLGVDLIDVEVVVSPAKSLIPYCCDYRVVNSCADIVAKVKGEYLLLDII